MAGGPWNHDPLRPRKLLLHRREMDKFAGKVQAKGLTLIPLMIQYNPAVIQIDEARNGGFLSGGTQEIAVVQRVDQQKGQAIISATRQPNTPGVDGNGTVLVCLLYTSRCV